MDNRAEQVFRALKDEFQFKGAEGKISFYLNDYDITVEQNNVVGNILEEWLAKWLTSKNIYNKHNHRQASPDFWLNQDDDKADWLEIKSFTGSPNFDLAAFRSFIKLIIDEPWKLQSNYLLIKYSMKDGIVTIKDFWLKKIWEVSCTSSKWPIKVQCKRGVINNIRPATWYAKHPDYPVFKSLEHFLSALEETIYRYHDTRTSLSENWESQVIQSYKNHFGVELCIPRWNDIKGQYLGL
ncbi:MAG: NgoBV family restriction endonuclease [Prevotella sp.]|nr:NgoBV family restriction endonuclease [Prevotella sp.]MDY4625331.1 NgoBV family restriction endonuclease [Prevotella sp.]MDY5258778.1 NgoBV family restriction endonuclease [Prevotella sp.]